jgi:hypothetical protein
VQELTRKHALTLLLVLLILLTACGGSEGGTDVVYGEVKYEYSVTGSNGAQYEIDYSLPENLDLQKLVKGAELVLIGEVVHQEVFGLADLMRWSELRVLQVSKGKYLEETVKVLHTRTCPIYVGEEYLLALVPSEGWPDRGYEIMGSHQGIFRQKEGAIEVTNPQYVDVIEERFRGKEFTIYDMAKWFRKF